MKIVKKWHSSAEAFSASSVKISPVFSAINRFINLQMPRYTTTLQKKKKILQRQLRSIAMKLIRFATLWAGEGWPQLS